MDDIYLLLCLGGGGLLVLVLFFEQIADRAHRRGFQLGYLAAQRELLESNQGGGGESGCLWFLVGMIVLPVLVACVYAYLSLYIQ
jgi:hypothetical protein